ncbi:MAG: hypothetical protein R3C05_05285 [Pirellulaceae bacterium]
MQDRFRATQCLRTFKLHLEQQASTICWTGGASSDWNTASNWDLGRVPTATDDVLVDLSPSGAMTLGSFITSLTFHVRNLTVIGDLRFFGGQLRVDGDLDVSGRLTLLGGTLTNANLIGDPLETPVYVDGTVNMDNVRISTRVIAVESAEINVNNGLIVDGILVWGENQAFADATLAFNGNQTLGGSGKIVGGNG